MLRRRMKSDRGAAVVEFALVVPLLFAIVLGIVGFGYAFWIQSQLSGAAREGARAMALDDPNPTLRAQTAFGFQNAIYTPGSPCPTATPAGGPPNATFTITYSIGLMEEILPILPDTLTGTGVMRCNG